MRFNGHMQSTWLGKEEGKKSFGKEGKFHFQKKVPTRGKAERRGSASSGMGLNSIGET